MDIFWAFLMVLSSSLIVFLTSYFIFKNFSEKELQTKRFDIRMKNQSVITPIRLQAYERITLFLERIQPNSLIMRVQNPNMNVSQLHGELLANIRAEFEHNLSQQIYISQPAWEIVKSAKENTIKVLNTIIKDVDQKAPAIELSKAVLAKIAEAGKSPSDIALEFLKKEVGQYF